MWIRALFVCLGLSICAYSASAQDRPAIEKQFRLWLEQEIWPRARSAQVSRQVFESAFDGVTLDWNLPDLVPPGSAAQSQETQHQAEFGAPARYFRRSVLDEASKTGRLMAQRHADILARIEAKTGVPGRIILGIWGRESAYGRARIRHDAFRVLGTKGFMSTRAPYFTDELIDALRMLEGGTARSTMRSSWAGALGQPQFMPSSFLEHATDGDGDGRADIWTSQEDTLASIARYLAHHDWQAGRDWGFEVNLPPGVSCTLEGPDQGRKIKDWAALGITRIFGKPFPAHELDGMGYLMMPAGRKGPAFIVTPNFYVLKDYNMSDLYALFVGHMGDRIQYGMGDFRGAWRDVSGLRRSDVVKIQRALEGMGHDVGGADGLAGYKTRRSIGRWQEATNRPATCFPKAGMASEF